MENERSLHGLLADTKVGLDEILKQHEEINNVLDLIEKRQKKGPVERKAGKTVENSEEDATHSFGAERTDIDTENALGHEVTTGSSDRTNDEMMSTTKQTDERTREGSDGGEDARPRGILKKPNHGLKRSYGFKERLDLKFDHVMYGSQLRRNVVELNQDNRLCLQFGLPPNVGCVYESRRPLANVGSTATQDNGKRQRTMGNSLKPNKASPEGETMEHVAPGTLDRRLKEDKQTRGPAVPAGNESQTSEEQVQGKELVTKSSSGPMQLAAIAQQGTQLKLPMDAWSSIIADNMKIEGLSRDDLKDMNTNVMEALFGKSDTVDFSKFLNITKDQYKDMVKKMSGLEGEISAEVEQNLEESAKLMFDEDGKLNLVKSTQVGMQFMSEDMKAAANTMILGGSGTEQRSITGTETRESPNQPPVPSSQPVTSMQVVRPNIEPRKIKEKLMEDEPSKVEERVDIEPEVWIQYANEEIQKGRIAQEIRERGMDTIICLDISQSMKRGDAWNQAITFIKQFIDGIQNSTLMDNVYEHVALATFGVETRVVQHLTCDYLEVIRKLERLKPGGTSPMYAGLQMVHAAVIGAGSIFVSCNYKMHPRVLLVTDGKYTPTGMIAGPDDPTGSISFQDTLAILSIVKELHDKFHVTINPVPVGDFDLSILEQIASASNGKVVSPEDWKMQARVFKNNLAASKIAGNPLAKLLNPELRRMLIHTTNQDASPEDKIQMEEFLKNSESDMDVDSDNEVDGFPPLGSRVRRYKALTKQSRQEFGTVTKHMADGHIGVTWDVPDAEGSIREKIPYIVGESYVTIVDKPRKLHDEMIAEGCRVKRGKDWHYGDQDGGDGNLGNVFLVKPDGIVKVRWDNGHKNTYMFGAGGKFDLEIIQGTETKGEEIMSRERHNTRKNEGRKDDKVKEMNKRNRNIYDLGSSNGPQPEPKGAMARPIGSDKERRVDANENKQIITEIQKKKDNTRIKDTTEVSSNSTLDKSEESARSSMEIMNRRNAANMARSHENWVDKTSEKQSMTNNGAKPKTRIKQPVPIEKQSVQWLWQDGDTWNQYPPDICDKIEKDYERNPRGTTLICHNDVSFRMVFPRMEQVNIKTRDKYTIQRKSS